MKRLTPLLLLAPALAWSCSDDSGGGGGGGAGMAGTMMAGGGSAGDGAAGGGMGGDDMPDAGGDQLSFAEDIHPILMEKCSGSGCHSGAFVPHANEDVDVAYAATQATSTMGNLVYERMVERTGSDDPLVVMPPSFATPPCQGPPGSSEGCLSVEQFELLQAWAEQGALP